MQIMMNNSLGHYCWLAMLLLISNAIYVSPRDSPKKINPVAENTGAISKPSVPPSTLTSISTSALPSATMLQRNIDQIDISQRLPIKDDATISHKNSLTSSEALRFTSFSAITQDQQLSPPHGRSIRQADAEQDEKCRLFVEGEPEKNELYSPDYPNNYPKNINCTRVITAPKGQIIRLDFRNSFHIEDKEDCKFDFLEIRDGQYGFSNLIGKYCGTDFPPEITSKERYLWLNFHSDESIEYSGFTAVYEFMDRSREAPSTDLNCTIERDGYEGWINSSHVPYDIKDIVIKNKIPLDCMWRIQVREKWKIQVKFYEFKLSKPNDCESNFLDFFPEQTVMPLRIKNFCGSAGEGITSDSNILHMRFYAEEIAIGSTFAILYTAFRDRGTTACTDDEYDCEDATCISKELQCNGRDNCKFRWDEEGCETESPGQSEHVVIIIIVFGLILGGMVITFLVNCIRKIMHDQKIIRDVPGQSDGIYHIESFILGAPKAAVSVGLHNQWILEYNLDDELNANNDSIDSVSNGSYVGCPDGESFSFNGDEQLPIVTGWNGRLCTNIADELIIENETPESSLTAGTISSVEMETNSLTVCPDKNYQSVDKATIPQILSPRWSISN